MEDLPYSDIFDLNSYQIRSYLYVLQQEYNKIENMYVKRLTDRENVLLHIYYVLDNIKLFHTVEKAMNQELNEYKQKKEDLKHQINIIECFEGILF